MDEIIPGIFLGNLSDAKKVVKKKLVKAIVNVCRTPYKVPKSISYFHVSTNDNGKQETMPFLFVAADLINLVFLKKKNVLVHCAAGRSRSAATVIIYLMKYKNMKYEDAYNLVKSKRNIITMKRFGKFLDGF